MDIIKKIIIIQFKLKLFLEEVQIIQAYTFLKPYTSKICNDLSLYIYIYI